MNGHGMYVHHADVRVQREIPESSARIIRHQQGTDFNTDIKPVSHR